MAGVAGTAAPAATAQQPACPLCDEAGGRVVFQHPKLRVIHADEPGLAAFYRVVWQAHVREWTDLDASEQWLCLRAVAAVEQAMREVIAPHKINLASLGNMVAHLHWHVIARYEWDAFFPAPVWAAPHTPLDQAGSPELEGLAARRDALEQEMQRRLALAMP